MIHRTAIVLAFFLLIGCAPKSVPELKPDMQPGSGAIVGQLVGADQSRFDLALAGDKGIEGLEIKLISPANGVIAKTHPRQSKSDFSFSDVEPGAYEVSLYLDVPNQRTIAASKPVVVQAGQVTEVMLTLEVKPIESKASP